MIKISHRGNINGAVKELENSPAHLFNAISYGFDVEVDVWVIDGLVYFGHDTPQYLINQGTLDKLLDKSWFHCKNLNALNYFFIKYPECKFFWHQKDDYTITSNGYIWTYPGKEICDRTILVHLDKYVGNELLYGICSDELL
jgi:hypothetical protein